MSNRSKGCKREKGRKKGRKGERKEGRKEGRGVEGKNNRRKVERR
jgi:hypothetical protein